jgi:alpha-tubulin suppressor-like RCC1 family protein
MKKPGLVGPLTDKRVCMVACGGPYTVLATDDEQVWAFGANARGQLGLGEQSDESMVPRKLSPPKDLLSWKVELIACGYAHTVFLTDDLCVFESPRPTPRQRARAACTPLARSLARSLAFSLLN